jgi:hypothetical protein
VSVLAMGDINRNVTGAEHMAVLNIGPKQRNNSFPCSTSCTVRWHQRSLMTIEAPKNGETATRWWDVARFDLLSPSVEPCCHLREHESLLRADVCS